MPVEAAVLARAIYKPAYGPLRMGNELQTKRISVSLVGVICVWLGLALETICKRLKALEVKSARGLVLTEDQVIAQKRAKNEKPAV